MELNIKIPKLEGNSTTDKQELKAFCRQVVDEIKYQRQLLETILEKAGG